MTPAYANAEAHHAGNGHPQWSQSYYFNFYDPRSRAGGFMRIGLLETAGQSNMILVLFRDGRPCYYRIREAAPYTSDRLDRGVEVAGLRLVSLQPSQKAKLEFADNDFTMNLAFEGLCPMADAIAMTHNEAGALAQGFAAAHLEGPGKVSGTIRLRESEIEVNGTGFRDVSWGVRNWETLDHYCVSWPVFDNGLAFAGLTATTVQGQRVYMKMLYDGGQWRAVQELDDVVEFSDDELTVKSLRWRYRDSLDREWEYTARPLFRVFVPFDGFLLTEHMMEYRLADGTIGYGLCECGFRLPREPR
ncbi:MAG: hypothetical protein HY899_19060 [Deltaproteobacteria bacterium]|nr:hypothetical protein [Deltaproteobacteria bacterium]